MLAVSRIFALSAFLFHGVSADGAHYDRWVPCEVRSIPPLRPLPSLFAIPTWHSFASQYTGSILYIGSHHSLSLLDSESATGRSVKVETVSKRDAMLFPVIGSVALFSMYLAYKFFGAFWVNMLLTTYLTCVGLVALAQTLRPSSLADETPLPACMRGAPLPLFR